MGGELVLFKFWETPKGHDAGFSPSTGRTVMAAVKGLTPIATKRIQSVRVNLAGGQHIRRAQQHMQVSFNTIYPLAIPAIFQNVEGQRAQTLLPAFSRCSSDAGPVQQMILQIKKGCLRLASQRQFGIVGFVQAVERHLNVVGHLLVDVCADLRLKGCMEAPRRPFAMSELLATLAKNGTAALPTSTHPVLAVRPDHNIKTGIEAQPDTHECMMEMTVCLSVLSRKGVVMHASWTLCNAHPLLHERLQMREPSCPST